jgi:hypothetical protein
VAIKAYRDTTLPYPEGFIIAGLHYGHLPSEQNDQVFGDQQSSVPGPPTNVQFMAKDSKNYAATGGWGFGHFGTDGKPGADAAQNLLAMPREGFSRFCVHALGTVTVSRLKAD